VVENPSLVPSAVEEILRHAPAVHYFRRTANEDTEIRGQKIREGEKVTLWYPSANYDEEVFDEPERFDIHRSPNDHLSFGIGEHFCLGANLARSELFIKRIRNPEFAGPVRRLRSNFINGVKEMRIKFTPETAQA
jgi:cytochrome P450